MIEFKGYLSKEAEKYFWKTQKILNIKTSVFCSVLFLGIGAWITGITHEWLPLLLSLLICLILTAGVLFIPQGKKEKSQCTVNRIFTDDGYIVSVCEKSTAHKLIKDAQALHDYGEFYQVVFSGGISAWFICQKDLLTQGTLEDFEALFEGKIVRKY